MDISMRPFPYIYIRTELFSTQSETLEINDFQFRVSFFQHFSYSLLAIHDIFPGSAGKLLSGIYPDDL